MNPEFIIERHGKKYVLYAGLLDAAHSAGLRGIETELLQIPDGRNGSRAIVKAEITMERIIEGEIVTCSYTGIGDASPENVGRNIAPHVIRMAETRAKARALRDALNSGAADLDDPTTESGVEVEAPQTLDPESLVVQEIRILARSLYGGGWEEELERRVGRKLDTLTPANADSLHRRLQDKLNEEAAEQ